jgi:hypothetical protein
VAARNSELANSCGIVSLAIICIMWLLIRERAPITNVYVIYVVIPIVAAVSLIAAIVAVIKGSKWWLIAVIPPIITALDVLVGD